MGHGKRLKELLDYKGISVKKMAEMSDIPATTLYSIINRDTRIKDSLVEKLSDALEIETYILQLFLLYATLDITYIDYVDYVSEDGTIHFNLNNTWLDNNTWADSDARKVIDIIESKLYKLNTEGLCKVSDYIDDLISSKKYTTDSK